MVAGLGCGALEPREELVISATFPHREAAAAARLVETRIFGLGGDDPSPCRGLIAGTIDLEMNDLDLEAEHARTLEPTDGGAPAAVGFVYDLTPGTKAIYGEARDQAGALTLRGCATSAASTGVAVELPLHAID